MKPLARQRKSLRLPEPRERHGEVSVSERECADASVQNHATPIVRATLLGEAPEALPIGRRRRDRGFHFHTPGLAAARNHQVHLHLILVSAASPVSTTCTLGDLISRFAGFRCHGSRRLTK